MTDAELDELEMLAKEATPGPWATCKQHRPEGRSFIVTSNEALHSGGLQHPLSARQCDQGLRCLDLH